MKYSLLITLLALIFIIGCIPDRELTSIWDDLPETKELLITSPNSSTIIPIDTSFTYIEWYNRCDTSVKQIDFYLLLEDAIIAHIKSTTYLSDTLAVWYPSKNNYGASDRYRILVRDRGNPLCTDTSDYFTITSPYSGGYTISTEHVTGNYQNYLDIDWTTTGSPGSMVNLQLYKGSTYLYTIIDSLKDTSGYYWEYPKDKFVEDTNYTIRLVSTLDNSISTISNPFLLKGSIITDSFEVDNTITTAKPLLINETQSRTNYLGDVDWISLQLQAGVQYHLSIANCEDLGIKLYASDGTTLLQQDTSSYDSDLLIFPITTGTYYAKVYRQWLSSYDFDYRYSVSLNQYNPEYALLITNPQLGDTLDAGDYTGVSWTEINKTFGSYICVELYKNDNLYYTIDSSDYISSDRFNWYSIPWLESGYYRYKVTDTRENSLYAFSDSFYISGMTNELSEPNNSKVTATKLTINTNNQALLAVGDQDWYRIPVKANFVYSITANPDSAIVVSLHNGSDQLLMEKTTQSPLTFSHNTAVDDTLTLVVDAGQYNSHNIYGGSYTVSVTEAHVDSVAKITKPDAVSVFSINEQGEITWDAPVLGATVTLYLYKNGVSHYHIASHIANSGSYSWKVPKGLSTGSDYQVKISSPSDTGLSGFSQMFSISGISPDTFEIDQPINFAKEYSTFAQVDTHTILMGDTDWVKVPIEPGYYFTTAITSDFYCRTNTYKTSMLNKLSTTNIDSTTKLFSYLATETDTMLVEVVGYNKISAGSYQLSVEKTPVDSLILLSEPNEESIYAAGSSYSIKWKAPTLTGSLKITLLKGGIPLEVLDTYVANDGLWSWSVNSGHATASDYQIQIKSYSDSTIVGTSTPFTIAGVKTDSYEPDNNKLETISNLTPNTDPQERTLTFNDTDMVLLPMIKDSLYALSLIPLDNKNISYFTIKLYHPTTEQLITLGQGEEDKLWLCTESGNYYASIYDVSSYARSGAYTMGYKEHGIDSYSPIVTLPSENIPGDGTTASTISWSNWELMGNKVDIFLFKDGQIVQSIASTSSNKGVYNWTPPATLEKGSGYTIRVISLWNSTIRGESSSFTIL